MKSILPKNKAIKFIVLLGIVSLFADMAYEGARSITGQYLAVLGASGAVVGVVAGFGELIGYGFRLVSGYISDKTGKYWLITILGYILNLIAVPLLALAGNWKIAATLMILERLGKSIRTPARDAMLSYATKEVGRGFGFGFHEATDQIGAIIGPLIISVVLYFKGSYQTGFAVLLVPVICALTVLFVARCLYPNPRDLEQVNTVKTKRFSRRYWLYIIAISLVGAGYIDFPLISYHFEKIGNIPAVWIPVLFSIAMAADAVAALVFGKLYDIKGIQVLILITLFTSFFAPLVFIDNFYSALAGMVLWGVGLGSQESIMRAVVADLVQSDKRATAYGTLNVWFGIAWFLGSSLMGFLYDTSIVLLVVFSMVMQIISIPILLIVKKDNFE